MSWTVKCVTCFVIVLIGAMTPICTAWYLVEIWVGLVNDLGLFVCLWSVVIMRCKLTTGAKVEMFVRCFKPEQRWLYLVGLCLNWQKTICIWCNAASRCMCKCLFYISRQVQLVSFNIPDIYSICNLMSAIKAIKMVVRHIVSFFVLLIEQFVWSNT